MRDITANRSSKCIKPPATWYTVKPPIQAINKITNKTVQMLMVPPPDLFESRPSQDIRAANLETNYLTMAPVRSSVARLDIARLDRGFTVAELSSLLYKEKPVVCLLQPQNPINEQLRFSPTIALFRIAAEVFNVNSRDLDWVNRQCTMQPLATFQQALHLTGGIARIKNITFILASGWSPSPFPPFYERA
jgi:hypothetical protein